MYQSGLSLLRGQRSLANLSLFRQLSSVIESKVRGKKKFKIETINILQKC